MDLKIKRITTPEEAVTALALAAHTTRQAFCIDESPLPTLLSKITWSAEEITVKNNRPASVMDNYYRTVFSEHPTNTPALTAQELLDTQATLLEFLGDEPNDRILEGIMEWADLLKAVKKEAV